MSYEKKIKINQIYEDINSIPTVERLSNQSVRSADVYSPPIFEPKGYRLYMNENLFGPSPKCTQIIQKISPEQMYLYPYGGDKLIADIIGKKTGVSPSQVIVNNGAAAVIQQIFQALLEKDDLIYLPKPGWDYYRGVASTLGANVCYYNILEKNKDFKFDICEMILGIRRLKPKVIVVTSPNMPTGNMISVKDLKKLAEESKNSIIVLDEAYYGFNNEDRISENEILSEYPNIIIIRTFSKLYGLASVRLGYALCNNKLTEVIKKVSTLFGVSWISQQIGKAALEDSEYYSNLAVRIVNVREKFRERVNKIDDMWAYPSHSNFVLINVGRRSPEEIISFFKKKDYLIRNCKGYGLNNHIRVSIGREEHMDDVAEFLKQYSELECSCNLI